MPSLHFLRKLLAWKVPRNPLEPGGTRSDPSRLLSSL
ncbi:HDLBP isoform 38, partial [Pan troglodytes]